jgi:hypothetical protein
VHPSISCRCHECWPPLHPLTVMSLRLFAHTEYILVTLHRTKCCYTDGGKLHVILLWLSLGITSSSSS